MGSVGGNPSDIVITTFLPFPSGRGNEQERDDLTRSTFAPETGGVPDDRGEELPCSHPGKQIRKIDEMHPPDFPLQADRTRDHAGTLQDIE